MKKIIVTALMVMFISAAGLFAQTYCLDFDGTNERVVSATSHSISVNATRTYEAWVKIDAQEEAVFAADGNTYQAIGMNSSGQFVSRSYDGSSSHRNNSGYTLETGKWYHVAAVFSGGNSTNYVNGVQQGSTASCPNGSTVTEYYYLSWGYITAECYYNGQLDEARIWSDIRTTTELQEYICEDVSSESNLLVYYRMTNGSGTFLTDNSPNSNSGTLINMEAGDWVTDYLIPSGDGASGTEYQIQTLNHLWWLSKNSGEWKKYFKQTADIDMTVTTNWDGGSGFLPMGTETGTQFEGYYDGDSHIISNLFINRSSMNDVGFFGYTDRDYGQAHSYIKNLGLENINITGGYRTAGLVGRAMSDISYCYVTGSITGSAGNSVAAGLTAQSHYPITDCYSIASVSAVYTAAGFVSFNNYTINNCYSTGAVSNATTQDGFCNDADGHGAGTISNCFWDTQTSGQSSSDGATGKTTVEMKTVATFTDESTAGLTTAWDFETNPNDDAANNNYWDMDLSGTINSGYPYLSWEDGGDVSLPVELASFTATAGNGQVTLKWTTESELENDAFLLERSKDNDSFVQIAEISGQGSSSSRHDYEFVDQNVIAGKTYNYRLSDSDYSGNITCHQTISITVESLPTRFALYQNYPNPFNPETTIRFDVPTLNGELKNIKLIIYNSLGQLVNTLYEGQISGGKYEMKWNGTNSAGMNQPSGVYFLNFQSERFVQTQKMILMR